MICKCLEKKIKIFPEESITKLEGPIELEYYLVESEGMCMPEVEVDKVYGIEIIEKIDDIKVESRLVKDFSYCKESTKSLLSKLVENIVTPLELPFILDDIIGT